MFNPSINDRQINLKYFKIVFYGFGFQSLDFLVILASLLYIRIETIYGIKMKKKQTKHLRGRGIGFLSLERCFEFRVDFVYSHLPWESFISAEKASSSPASELYLAVLSIENSCGTIRLCQTINLKMFIHCAQRRTEQRLIKSKHLFRALSKRTLICTSIKKETDAML